jgi:hypothetical protein
MAQLIRVIVAAAALGAGIALHSDLARSQGIKDLVGTWTVVSADNVQPDGRHVQPFGPNPQGILIFDAEGRYSLQICSAERPKFASNNRLQGTPEENKAAVHGCNPHWGRYAVTGDGAILFKIEHATFANWEGTEQKRLYTVKGDELTYKVPTASGGGTAELVWKRAK